ncbi:uncharacterized protein LOC112692862 [Sipha flava]|jgi:hypothetical protein|uniref:Uncharacterized protein LOC112692862 n=1 Tax=Sipha flava TaxID=143950 RepID=A0A8B8GM32_9HEMI|nr:uncharacterized protein LOC112692862 [Sipha flava]
MLLCDVCNEEIFDNEDIKCNKCKIFFHFVCAGFRESNFRKLSAANKSKWFCMNCKDSSSTLNVETNKEIKLSIDKECSHTDKILMDLKESVNFMSGQFDNFNLKLQDIIKVVNDVSKENKQLKEENQKLKIEMRDCNKKINYIEQKLVQNHIEIIGVPEETNEDCSKIVKEISTALGVNVCVESAFRYQSKIRNKHGKIVAVLKNYENKKTIMDMSRIKKLKANNVNAKWKEEGIYINNYLTQINRNLFYKTRLYAKENNYKYVWYRDCKIFIRKDEKNKVILIEDENSLRRL